MVSLPTISPILKSWSMLSKPLKNTDFLKIYLNSGLPSTPANIPQTICPANNRKNCYSEVVKDLCSSGMPL